MKEVLAWLIVAAAGVYMVFAGVDIGQCVAGGALGADWYYAAGGLGLAGGLLAGTGVGRVLCIGIEYLMGERN